MQKIIIYIIVYPLFIISLTGNCAFNGLPNDSSKSPHKKTIKDKILSPINSFIKDTHPRVLLDKERLELVINRMYGPAARQPYIGWFNSIKNAEDSGKPVDLVNLALIFKATKEQRYKDKFIERLKSKKGAPRLTELYAIDMMFNDLSNTNKQLIMQRVANSKHPWYFNSVKESRGQLSKDWGYHSAFKVIEAFAYSAIFTNTYLENNKNDELFPFDANNYIEVVKRQLSEDGYFYKIENRIAGDTKYNNALPGTKGGMYDNFSYDQAEESASIKLWLQYYVLTGDENYKQALHDKHRANFWQNMSYPHLGGVKITRNQWCRRKSTTTPNIAARIWNTQTDYVNQPRQTTTSVTAFLFQDPKMQYYANNGKQRSLCYSPYNMIFWELIYYDNTLKESPPNENPKATYFNGPGLVSMRSDWTKDATFGVFIAGEGIGRRYEDANSFLISRKVNVVPHAGARIRSNRDNFNHSWYHTRSISKNTLRILDPKESFDINHDGTTGDLHSGSPLVSSDNMGGQIFETSPSNIDGCFNTDNNCTKRIKRIGSAFPLSIYESANIIKFEHSSENQYTYSVGDATAAYTKKIDFFDREFLFLSPDVFVIFDRVKTVNPNFKKIWVMHTVDEPIVYKTPSVNGMGVKKYSDVNALVIKNPINNTYIDTLLPEVNKVEVRGGDSILANVKDLNEIENIALDIPRWLEIFIAGSDVIGTLTIKGDALEGTNTTEIVNFDGRLQTYESGSSDTVNINSLTDKNAHWIENQWRGFQISIRTNKKKHVAIITGNTNNTLYGKFITVKKSKYDIQRPFANTYKHWKNIHSVSTSDMSLNNLIMSVPHYYDTADVKGRLHSFSPHTDYKDDKYKKRKDLGQWTINVQAKENKKLDNFLNVISLKDPDQRKPDVNLIKSSLLYGARINDLAVFFAKGRMNLTKFTVPISRLIRKIIFTNLEPNSKYYITITIKNSQKLVNISTAPLKEDAYLKKAIKHSTSMGLIHLDLKSNPSSENK